MATVTHGAVTSLGKGAYRAIYSAIGAGSADDAGSALVVPAGYNDISIQVLGTFAGSTLTVQGSNDGGTTWATLAADPSGSMAFAAAGMKKPAEKPQLIRPVLTCGSSSSLNVSVVVRRS